MLSMVSYAHNKADNFIGQSKKIQRISISVISFAVITVLATGAVVPEVPVSVPLLIRTFIKSARDSSNNSFGSVSCDAALTGLRMELQQNTVRRNIHMFFIVTLPKYSFE